ncbi:MAG: hypothetical protein GWN01_03645 [Nitrosopumilaceae archaeon]|nr:hypothetical protein [Nitrosopumilaceae archaeon]NIU00052.1 hypothetical protein [Nitrosopumilaceae archaeon]NIU86431.1 hypothetical protein [Nitrosopumilaceae archaeon]NIV65140.1 hypothetical protein [Nitrosopumilaceae archaeon]NIX60654.1 hypothetical protein [Nitrosopumilaceae archaeon]
MARFHEVIRARRAVGGLISLIALIIVFGIASLAFLEINLTHADFVLNSIDISDKQHQRINEQLNFTITNSSEAHYDISISNIWNEQSIIESHITTDSNDNVVFQRYLNETTMPGEQNVIAAQENTSLVFDDANATHSDASIIFVTENGNKCIIPVPSEDNTLSRRC